MLDTAIINLGNLSVDRLVQSDGSAIDWTLIGNDIFTLIAGEGTIDFGNVVHTETNRFDLGDGREAYFKEGSLQLVVIPEPSTLALLGIALGSMLFFRRRK